MKKAMLTIGLFSMMLVLTSFTTPYSIDKLSHDATTQYAVILPTQPTMKFDNEPGTISPTIPSKKLDFEPGTVSPTVKTKKVD